MAKGFITIKDVPQHIRSKAADRLRGKVREMLTNPFLPGDQRAMLVGQMGGIADWEAGSTPAATLAEAPKEVQAEESKVEVPKPKASKRTKNALVRLPTSETKPTREPQNHVIEVVEQLDVKETP